MKTFLILPALLIIAGILFTTSCEIVEIAPVEAIDEEETPLIQGPSQTLSDEETFAFYLHGGNTKSWAAQGFTISGISGFQQCRLDDNMVLGEDGTYQYDGGETLCGAEDNQRLKTGTWEIEFDESMLIFNKGTQIEYQVIVSGLDENTIVLDGTYFGLEIRGIYISN